MNVSKTFGSSRRSRATRAVAFAMVVLFLNLLVAVDVARLAEGGGLGLQAARAAAAASRRVGVFVLADTDKAAQTAQVLNSIIRENTRQLEDVQLMTGVTESGVELLPQIEQLADRGFQQLNDRDHVAAAATFTQAEQLVQRALSCIDRRLHARVLKGLGVAKFLAGDTATAEDRVKKALLVFPKQSAGEYDYALEVKNLYREMRRQLQDESTGTLEVTSDPAGAEVHVDHYLKGYTTAGEPLKLQNLQAGPHFVRLRLGGYDVWADYVQVDPAGTATVDATLEAAATGARFRAVLDDARSALRSGRGVEPAMKSLRSQLDATELLVVLAQESAEGFELRGFYLPPEGELVSVEESVVQDATLYQNLRDLTAITIGGEYVAQEVLALDGPAGAGADVSLAPMGAGAEDLVLNPDSPIFAGTRRAQPTPVYKEWWFWTIIGVAAAGATTGIVLLTTSQGGGGGGPTGGVTVNLNNF